MRALFRDLLRPGCGLGDRSGGPAGGGEERYVEIWNLVFMQYDRQGDATLVALPKPNIDTGAGLERIAMVLQDVPAVWETDLLRPIIAEAEKLTGRQYGSDGEVDVALRILADHTRSMTFLIGDGVFPSNEDRGYVLRRLIRRAVRQAYTLGVEKAVTPALDEACVSVMGPGYPDLVKSAGFITGVAGREEGSLRATLRSGLAMLEADLSGGATAGLRRRGLPAARHTRVPSGADPRNCLGARRGGRRGRVRDGHATPTRDVQAGGQGARPGGGRSARGVPGPSRLDGPTALRRLLRQLLHDRRSWRSMEAGPTAWSRYSSTPRRFTRRAADRWATPA